MLISTVTRCFTEWQSVGSTEGHLTEHSPLFLYKVDLSTVLTSTICCVSFVLGGHVHMSVVNSAEAMSTLD